VREGFFSGSFGGDLAKINAASRLECKICWYVYDPGQGDDSRQVMPGTPFADLPDDWSCPNCSGVKSDFLVLEV
jgi:rubredoxin